MRTLLMMAIGLVGLAFTADLQGQKKKPATLVSVAFEDTVDADGDPDTPPTPTAVYGAGLRDGQVETALTTESGPVCFRDRESVFAAAGAYAPIDDCATGAPSVHTFGGITVGDAARQANITWVDSRGWEYRLQYGDAFTQPLPPNYVHILCVALTADNVCVNALVDTQVGSFPSGESASRVTGPIARLTVRTGSGRRNTFDLGHFEVPFAISVQPR